MDRREGGRVATIANIIYEDPICGKIGAAA